MDSKIEKGDTWGREETGHGSASRQRGGVLLSNPAPLSGVARWLWETLMAAASCRPEGPSPAVCEHRNL